MTKDPYKFDKKHAVLLLAASRSKESKSKKGDEMTNMTVVEFLEKYPDACEPAVKWLEETKIVFMHEAWERCPKGDWMWWVLGREKFPTKKLSVRYAKSCAKRAAKYADDLADSAVALPQFASVSASATYAAAAYAYAASASAAYAAAASASAYASAAYASSAAYAAYADAYVSASASATHAADAAYAAYVSAYASATYASAASADANERKLQAEWLRERVDNPFRLSTRLLINENTEATGL